jgi:hypothetical protein
MQLNEGIFSVRRSLTCENFGFEILFTLCPVVEEMYGLFF